MKTQAKLFLIAAVSLAATIASADTIELKDGRTLSGAITRQGDNFVITADDGTSVSAASADVVRIALKSSDPSAPTIDSAQSEWSRSAAQIKQSSDLQAIIKLHQKFLAQYPDSALAQGVGASLAEFQKMADGGAIKFHGQWMTPDAVAVVSQKEIQAARPALDAYAAGRIDEAQKLAAALLAKDDQNAPALAITGLVACRAGKLSDARKYFDSLAQSDPANLLAQNNLAVISFQQNQLGAAMTHYLTALLIAPDSRALLDNITELVHIYQTAGGDKNVPLYRALSGAYAQAEANMETNLAKKDLRRYGSTWVTSQQRDAAVASLKSIHDQMDLLDTQFQITNSQLASLNVRIQQVSQEYDAAQNGSQSPVLRSVNGHIPPQPFGAVNIDTPGGPNDLDHLGSLKGSLEAQRDVLLSHLPDLHSHADDLKSQLAAAGEPFTGDQILMDLEFTGHVPSPAPEAAPAVASAAPAHSQPQASPPTAGAPNIPAIAQIPAAAPSPAAEIALAGNNPEEAPAPPVVHGGSYNPPSIFIAGPFDAHLAKPSSPEPQVQSRSFMPTVLQRWRKPRNIGYIPNVHLPLQRLPDERGKRITGPNGTVNLDDVSTTFILHNGQWTAVQNGHVVYQSNLPVSTYIDADGYQVGANGALIPNPSQGSGAWLLDQNGQAVRQSQVSSSSGTWIINQNGQAVRQ